MAKYLLNTVNTYRVATVAEAKALHQELKDNGNFEVTSFSYAIKQKKTKKEIVDEWVVCKAKLTFTDEKEPDKFFEVEYNEI